MNNYTNSCLIKRLRFLNQLTVISILCLLGLKTSAQDIATDSKGKGVFTFYSTKKYRFDFSSKDFSLALSTKPRNINFILRDRSDDNTVDKREAFYIQPSIINAIDIVSLSNFNSFRPGARLRIGYQMVVDTVHPIWHGKTYGLGINVFYSFDNIKLFDTLASTVGKRYPGTIGVEANYIQYFSGQSKWILLALNTSLSNGWNDAELLNYKEISSATVKSNVIAFEKFDGKFGHIKKDILKWRFSASLPINAGYFNPIPYAVVVVTTSNQPSYFIGLYTNLLADRIDFRVFKLPSSFGIGVDWNHTDGKWSSPNIFIRGAISFGKFE